MEDYSAAVIDEIYEFSAPRFYDFITGETQEEKTNAELWFETAISHAPSPVMPKIKIGRDVQISIDFSDADQMTKAVEPSESTNTAFNDTNELKMNPEQNLIREVSSTEISEENRFHESLNEASKVSVDKKSCKVAEGIPTGNGSTPTTVSLDEIVNADVPIVKTQIPEAECTPKLPVLSAKRDQSLTMSRRQQTAKRIASLIKNPSALKTKGQFQLSQTKCTKPGSARRDMSQKISAGTPNLAQENQAIKRQKLEGGQSRKILNIKPQNLTHKSRLGLTTSSARTTIVDSTAKTRKEDRKVYVREPAAAPFVSMAEMVKKFQSSTRASHDAAACAMQGKQHMLTLTRPKEPEFETSQRARSIKLKSTAELEEELMAKMPKFKARRLNKKIFEAPTLPPMPKSVRRPPEFQEFHLETMARATKNAEASSVVSTEESRQQNNQWMPHLTEPKTPLLQTSLRARPIKVKSSLEIEQEELEKIPKFKARPLNKKIFESKGDMGLFCNNKKQATVPQEFHFAIDDRIPPPPPAAMVIDLFDKLSISSDSCNQVPKKTKPNPFHLHTEERGAEKERRFYTELMQKEMEEERSRTHKANPYPFTTDFPVIPPKPEPKQCTRPEPFQLESLMRHEVEMQREMEERLRKEKEEAHLRIFKAQPVLKEDPIPLPEKERKPLTQVQGFNLHIEHRAVERTEFDKKVKEKERMYKRYREESEAAKMMEEEKALKQLRRTLVPHARPVPKFANPFIPQKSSKETTKAKSPKLRVDQRKERHNMVRAMAAAVATSSSASQMR